MFPLSTPRARGRRPWWFALPLSLLATALFAQETPPEPPLTDIPVQALPETPAPAASEAVAENTRLQDVVVTAQKKKQSLQKVPVSVGVVLSLIHI